MVESLDPSQIFVCGVGWWVKFTKEKTAHKTNCWHAFRMLLPA